MQTTANQIRLHMLNNYLTLYKIKSNPHHYKSVRNQKRIYSTQSLDYSLHSTLEVTELKQPFSQDLKKNIFYKRDFFKSLNTSFLLLRQKQIILFSTIIHSDERKISLF